LFVAMILEGFEQTSKHANNLLLVEHLDHFREAWLEYDPDVSDIHFNLNRICLLLESFCFCYRAPALSKFETSLTSC
jgi:hypothetical protein